jgi:glycosyltransferase involved in cell wall biosynthesis
MRVAIVTVQCPFVRGGAEMHADGLRDALEAAGHEADILSIPFKWYPPAMLPEQTLACRLLDVTESMGRPIDRVIGLKFPAYLTPHPNKVLWILHQHRSAYDLWDQRFGDLFHVPDGEAGMRFVRDADTRLIPEARRVFANSRNVADRLQRFCGIDSTPLYHPPPHAGQFREGETGDYLLMPSRVNEVKRQDLVVEAMLRTRHPVRVCFTGGTDAPAYQQAVLARGAALEAGRLQWLGPVTHTRKLDLFANALAVLVPPFDEDYGYVALEAMLSARAVVTCSDSGGPLEFIEHGRNGLVCEPSPEALAEAMDHLWENRGAARHLGQEGRAHFTEMDITWEHAVACLLE